MGKKNKKDKNKEGKGAHAGHIVEGRLEVSRSGMGFVIVSEESKDILVRPHHFGLAFHGDLVKVSMEGKIPAGPRAEGRVVAVIERKQTEFIGNLQTNKNVTFFIPAGDKGMPDFFIPPGKMGGAKDGDRVVVKLVKWDKPDKKPEGEVITLFTSQNASDQAMKEILIDSGFPLEFEKDVLQAALALDDGINPEDLKKRKDFRDILTFTIDPVDARDFDDAISFQKIDNGLYEIGVHIADVSHFVTPGSILDHAAFERATSVYLPDRVNPMLPERISNELCSLRPHEDKFTFSAVFKITAKGEIRHTWIGRTLIHSDHRFTYEDVQQIIETKEGPHKKEVLLLNELARHFRKDRFKKGAINFSSTEVRFKLDENGKPIGIVVKESKESHQLIEEFMLLANRAVAEYVSGIKVNKQSVPFPYRIHDQPNDEKLAPFAAFARKFGYKFDLKDEKSVVASFNKLLEEVKGKPEQHVLEQLGIRTMAKAIYTAENIGHYGLGFDNYCHFTSPIRRYPDVLVHRILQECLDKAVIIDKKMEEKCRHCSERERAAMEAERAGNKYKQVEYMRDFVGEEFDGVISGVASFGFWVETIEHKCEGLVTIRDLNDYDDFRLNDADYALVGLRSGKKFRMGDKVRIQVAAANLDKRQLDYIWKADREMAEKSIPKKKKK